MSNHSSSLAQAAPASSANLRFYLFPVLAVCIWSGNTIITKAAAGSIEPAAIAFYRWVLAVLVMTPFLGREAWRQRTVIAAHWPRLMLLGALGMAMYQGLAYEAAHTTSAVNMGVTVALMPLISACLSSLFAGERLSLARIAGGLLSLLGLVVVSAQGEPDKLFNGANGLHVGDALMLIAVSSNALYGVLLRRWSLPLSTWTQLYVQAAFGSLILLPFWLAAPASPLTAHNLPMVLYAGLLASIGAPFLWMNAVKHLGAPRSALFANLIPLLVALAAWALLGEQLHAYHALGGALVLTGVVWGQRSKP